MLAYISLAVLVLGFVLFVAYHNTPCYKWYEFPLFVSMFVTVLIGVIAMVVSLGAIATSYIGVNGYIEENHRRYETLVWQYENDVYENDNDLGKRELIKDIQDWNEDLAWYKTNEKDFWIGIFIPDIYDQFEFIKLEASNDIPRR